MEICYCNPPEVFQPENCINKACKKCGNWWMPEHGSLPEGGVQDIQMFEFVPSPAYSLPPKKVVVYVPPYEPCPCGSGKKHKFCCRKKV